MRPAHQPRSALDVRILVVDGASGEAKIVKSRALPELLTPGDLVVVNDAATLPASLFGSIRPSDCRPARGGTSGSNLELRLLSWRERHRWTVALLGAGDYRTRTEDRPPPPQVEVGTRIELSGLVATVVQVHDLSPRLVDVELAANEDANEDANENMWAALYRAGRPVQYAYVSAPLALWDVQNVYAGRPWAVEMPSAGRALRAETLGELRRRGIEVAAVTHAAGLSSVGDPAIDARLPFPERYDVPPATWEAVTRAKRVIAIGTSVVRALETRARTGRSEGVTDLILGPSTPRLVVDALLTGVHEAGTSHFQLLGAFADRRVLARLEEHAEGAGLLGHEMGDACLLWGQPRDNLRRPRGAPERAAAAC
jgi:S-adenosylmethionine:tRNA ribosyltransferase-isomerase